VSEVLARRDQALSPEETAELLRDRVGDAIGDATVEYGTFTLWVANERYADVAELCRDERLLAFDFFDCLFGVDARDEGFDVVTVLYSTSTGNRICLRTRCPGGRETPTCPSLTGVYRGADWHEREAWDMFGIEFAGHPALEPRIFTVENFEGWPLRKDFPLATRAAKPWPGVKEPAELDDEGNVIERKPQLGDAPGPYELDKAMAEQAKLANPQPAADPATREGEEVEDKLGTEAEQDPVSGAVLAGDAEHELEQKEDVRSEAREKAEEKRKAAAEARARKAAERAAAGDTTELAAAAGGAVEPGEDQVDEADTAEATEGSAGGWGNEGDDVPGARGDDEPSAPGDGSTPETPAGPHEPVQDPDGTDADGTDADGTDSDGTDGDGTDGDGTDGDGEERP
jgi:NADH:ubiquinone oxidoreductase subunit C